MKTDYLERQSYPTDLTDEQWAIIAPLFVAMREYKHSKRELTNAVLTATRLPAAFHRPQLGEHALAVCGTKSSNTWL